uniref:HMA domain-containing protein n=1 Tax=Salix viminalis TaxID=40686 RepID=A0A6N2KA97_SALVM
MGEEAKQEQAKAEAKPEEKKEENVEAKKEEKPTEDEKKEEPKPPSPFVLFVDLHCVGCAKKIERSIMKIRGVEGVAIDMAQNQVTIKGIVEPQAVSGLTTVELDINMHCEACAEQLKKKILKMRGVQTAATDLSSSKVTVTGTMEASKLVEYIYRRTKKQARILPQPEPEPETAKEEEKPAEEAKPAEATKEEKKEEEKPAEEGGGGDNPEKNEKKEDEGKKEGVENADIINTDEENMKRMMHYYQPVYVIERIPPPQLFSDENPNACCIS